jgi:N4-gp56 family major capsid protein
MAGTSYGVNNALAVKAWAKKLFVEALKQTRYEQFKGATGTDSLVTLKTEMSKSAGDRVTIGLRMQLLGAGVQGDNTLEGQEEALQTYSDNLFIDQLRHAVRSSGKMSEQRVPFEVRDEAKAGLQDWWADRIDASLFNQLAGASTQQTQANTVQSTAVDIRFSGLQAAIAPDSAHLIICDQNGGNTTEASLSATFILALADIDRAVAKAKTLSPTPAIRPLNVKGEKMFVQFVHPNQTYQLRKNYNAGQWGDIQKAKLTGGQIGDNPIITGMLGVYNNTILVEDARVPCVASSVTSSTNYRRSVFCGAQAAAIGFGQNNSSQTMQWTEELFDYGNQLGVEAGMIWGLKKMVFNSADFGTLVLSGYAPAL